MTVHTPVLLQQVLDHLEPLEGKFIVDATFGGGGHAIALAEKGAHVLGLDKDPEAIREGRKLLSGLPDVCPSLPSNHLEDTLQFFSFPTGGRIYLFSASFAETDQLLLQFFPNIQPHAFLFDLGLSSDQLSSQRGFSFQGNQPLDMRFDPQSQQVTAAQLLNLLSAKQLAHLFREFGDERYAAPIARAIVEARSIHPIATTQDLVRVITSVVPQDRDSIHPATRVFQSLRMAVNSELDEIRSGLKAATKFLKSPCRILVISFHSGEDRLVKNFARDHHLAISAPIPASPSEIAKNPRSRSAKLRIISRA